MIRAPHSKGQPSILVELSGKYMTKEEPFRVIHDILMGIGQGCDILTSIEPGEHTVAKAGELVHEKGVEFDLGNAPSPVPPVSDIPSAPPATLVPDLPDKELVSKKGRETRERASGRERKTEPQQRQTQVTTSNRG